MTRLILSTTLFALTLATATSAFAQERTGFISAGVAAFPEFEGAEDYQVLPYLGGEIRWGNRYIALQGVTTRANLIDSSTWEAGPLVSIAFGRDDSAENAVLARLGPIDDAAEFGAFVARQWQSVLRDNDRLRISLQVRENSEADGSGLLIEPSVSWSSTFRDRLIVAVELSATQASAGYMKRYFGVTRADSLASGLPTYVPDSGVRDVGVTTTLSYALNKRWSIDGQIGFRRLTGDAADSPIVTREGSESQMLMAIGVGRRF
ncbi:MAG: MipA/OmpV family protein [Pseudomonadota bacterium]